jgi:hypothetical protein
MVEGGSLSRSVESERREGGGIEGGRNLLIVVALDPGNQAKERENLWLYSKGNVKVLYDVVNPEWHACTGP